MYGNVNYELKKLERLIAKDVSCVQQPCPRGHKSADGKDLVRREIERIRDSLLQKVFYVDKDDQLQRYVQYHQQALIQLMDQTACSANPELLLEDYTALETLLTFIKNHFPKYFDQDAIVPQRYAVIRKKKLAENIGCIESNLMEMNAERSILEVLLCPIRKLISSNSEYEVTYRTLRYAKQIQKQLLKVIDRSDNGGDINQILHFVLLYLNCNSKKSFRYFTHYITTTINTAETHGEKIERLSYQLKLVNQAPVKPGLAYNRYAPSLKNQLSNYICEEVDYLLHLQKFSVKQSAIGEENLFQDFKLKMDMSVSQLTYLIRVLVDTGVIQNKNIAEVIRFVANFCVTKRSESLSVGSLRSKYYEVETSTKGMVREMLVRSMGYIDGKRCL